MTAIIAPYSRTPDEIESSAPAVSFVPSTRNNSTINLFINSINRLNDYMANCLFTCMIQKSTDQGARAFFATYIIFIL